MIKKIIALLLAVLFVAASLVSCSNTPTFDPVESTEEEKRTVMTVRYGDNTYEVRYELYRAFFLNHKSEIDGGDESVWQGKGKDSYIERINEKIIADIAEIYAAFEILSGIGIDAYSKDYDKRVREAVSASVLGGYYGTDAYEGFGGDYEKYLESLKALGINYSVQDLLFRYAFALSDIDYYFRGNVEGDAILGHLEYTREDVERFYFSEDTVRVLRAFFPEAYYTEERVREKRDRIEALSGEGAVINYMIAECTSVGGADIKRGDLLSAYSLDGDYEALSHLAFSLDIGACAEKIVYTGGTEPGYHVIYRAEKSEANFNENYDYIKNVYVDHEIGKLLSQREDVLISSAAVADAYSEIIHANISMD